jgi:hypothetical protein
MSRLDSVVVLAVCSPVIPVTSKPRPRASKASRIFNVTPSAAAAMLRTASPEVTRLRMLFNRAVVAAAAVGAALVAAVVAAPAAARLAAGLLRSSNSSRV